MKKYLSLVLLISFVFINIACSEEPASIRVKNERTNKANVQIKQADGNTININDVSGGATSPYRDVVEGATIANAVIQNEQNSPSASFTTTTNRNYTIVITSTNPPTLRIDSADK
jgi:hypothetical protein